MLNASEVISKISWFCFDIELWKIALFGMIKCFINFSIFIIVLCLILITCCGADKRKIKLYNSMLQTPMFIVLESIMIMYILEVVNIIGG